MSDRAAPARSAEEKRAERKAALERLLMKSAEGGDMLELLASELPPAHRYAHALLAPLEHFDASFFETTVLPALPQGLGPGPDFEALRVYIERALEGGLRIEPAYAERCLERVRFGKASADPSLPTPAALVAFLGHTLESIDPSARDTLRLRLLAAARPAEAHVEFVRLFSEADKTFSLARCQALCDAVLALPRFEIDAEATRARALDDLEREVVERRAYLKGRVTSTSDFYRTGRYYRRDDVHSRLERWLDEGPYALNLYAKGGMGKTMLLQWLRARHCATWERRIPVASFDFDRGRTTPEDRAPWRVLFALAEALAPLLSTSDGSPVFGSLLESYRGLESPEFVGHFVASLRETLGKKGRALVLLDTLEDVTQDVERLGPLFDTLRHVAVECPGFRLLLAGRYALSEKAPVLWAHLPGAEALPLRPFERDESIEFAQRHCGVEDRPTAEAVADKVEEKLPFKLALLAEIAQAEGMTPAGVAAVDSVDLEYLVVRVLRRLSDPALEWVLRYGVIPRRLTLEFLREVMWPHLERENQATESIDDTRQGLESFEQRFQGERRFSRHNDLRTPDELWRDLCHYESSASWVSRDSHDPDALVFHQDVRAPMRRLLSGQLITALLHQQAASYFDKKSQEAADEESWARASAECYYHRFLAHFMFEYDLDMYNSSNEAPPDFISFLRVAAERAPSQLLMIASIAFDGDDLATAPVRRHSGEMPWLTPSQEAAALLIAADAIWTSKDSLSFPLTLPFPLGGSGPDPETVDAIVKRVERLVIGGAVLKGRDAERLAVFRGELDRQLRPQLRAGVAPLSTPTSKGLSDQQDLELRYRRFLAQAPPAEGPSTPSFREGLLTFFQEALITTSAPFAVRRQIVRAHMHELIEEDRPLDVIDAWQAAASQLSDRVNEDDELWCLGAEAMLRAGKGLPGGVPAGLAGLYETRALLFGSEHEMRVKWLPPAIQLERELGTLAPVRLTLAYETLAELFARQLDADRLTTLQAHAMNGSARDAAAVATWVARMQLFGFGNVREAEFYLRSISEEVARPLNDLRFDRYLIAIEVHKHQLQNDRANAVFQTALGEARNARPRHRVGMLLNRPLPTPTSTSELDAELEAIQSEAYRKRLRGVYTGQIFDDHMLTRQVRDGLLARPSRARAQQLEADARERPEAARALLEQARLVYLELDDRANAKRLELAFGRPPVPQAILSAEALQQVLTIGEVRVGTTSGVVANASFMQIVKPSAASGTVFGAIAQRPLGASSLVAELQEATTLEKLAGELGVGPDVDEVVIEAPSELAPLPYEVLLSVRGQAARPRLITRRRATPLARKPRAGAPLAVTVMLDGHSRRSDFDRYVSALTKQYDRHEIESHPIMGALPAQSYNCVVHVVATFAQRGNLVLLKGRSLHAAGLVKLLTPLPQVIILDAPGEGSPLARELLLRNAFAAQLFDVAPLPVVLAVGPGRRHSAGEQAATVASAVAALYRGESTPAEFWRAVREADGEAAFRKQGPLLSSLNTALFCDDPHLPCFERG